MPRSFVLRVSPHPFAVRSRYYWANRRPRSAREHSAVSHRRFLTTIERLGSDGIQVVWIPMLSQPIRHKSLVEYSVRVVG